MSEENATPEPSETDPGKAPAQEPNWKAEARKWETRAKENLSAAEELAKIREKNKTAEQREREEREQLTGRLTAAESKAIRLDIALDKGLTKAQAMRLVGTTAEELLADADQLAKDLGLEIVEETPEERQAKRRQSLAAPHAGGATKALNGDPLLAALKAAVGAQ